MRNILIAIALSQLIALEGTLAMETRPPIENPALFDEDGDSEESPLAAEIVQSEEIVALPSIARQTPATPGSQQYDKETVEMLLDAP
jgi:hypothetical protein